MTTSPRPTPSTPTEPRGLRVTHLGRLVAAGTLLLAAAAGAGAQDRPPIVLDTLPVLGSRTSAELPLRTRGVEVLDRRTLDALPARTVVDALRWATGVELSARSPAQADLQLRGGTFEQVLVLVDGVRMSDPQTGHFDLDLVIPLDRVERIEILRGPASAQYGSDAVGGVVNVVTRKGGAGRSARLEGGSFGTARLSLDAARARSEGGLDAHFSLEAGRSDGHREGTDWEMLLGTVRISAPLAGGRLAGDLGGARRDFGAADFYAPFPSFEATRTETAAVAWHPDPGSRIQLLPRISWRGHDDDFILIRESPEVYRNQHRSTQLGGEVTARFVLPPAGDLHEGGVMALGIEGARHALASNALGDRDEHRGAVFAEASLRGPGALDLSLGIRADRHESWGGHLSPSVAVARELGSVLALRGSWGRAFRGPTWTERYYADPGHLPNPDVAPESGSAWEAGVHVRPGEGVSLSVAAHTRTVEDLIDWARPVHDGSPVAGGDPAPTPAPWVPSNVSRARFQGVEVEGSWVHDAVGRISLAASTLSARARRAPGFESKYALRPLTRKVTLGIERSVPLGGGDLEGQLGVRLTHARRGAVRSLDDGGVLSPGEPSFQELDLRLGLPLSALPGGRSRIYLDLRNLLDAEHPDLTGNPVAGRALYLGVEVGGR